VIQILPQEVHDLLTSVNTDETLTLQEKWDLIREIVSLYDRNLVAD
jgi:hypothetical protein